MPLNRTRPVSLGKRILRDAVLGLAIIALIVLIFLIRIYTRVDVPLRWVELAVFTAVIFGYAVWVYRRYWRHAKFWMVLVGLLAFHLFAFTMVLRMYPDWRPVWFVGTSCIEYLILVVIVDKILKSASGHNI